MASEHPTRAAIAAAVAPAVAIAAFGNQWFSEHVRFEAKNALARRLVNVVGGPFQWTFTPRSGRDSGTIWFAQVVGVVGVLVLTFLCTWLAARAASKVGLLFAALGATVLSTMVAYGVFLLLSYDYYFDGHEVEPGINRFWYAVFHSSDPTLWALGVGLVAGLLAWLFSGGTVEQAPVVAGPWPVDRQPDSAPTGPVGAWPPSPAPSPPPATAPVSSEPPTTSSAPPPPPAPPSPDAVP
jgi:amino acid transporter